MKRAFVVLILSAVLCSVNFCFIGCRSSDQMGETEAEGHRRHQRNLRLNRKQLMEDIDTVLLLDEPSKLTDKRIP